jgi:hypothetical protein
MPPKIKPQKVILALTLATLGAGYFGSFSGLDVFPTLKPLIMLAPVQLGVLIYFLWWKPRND